MQKISVLLPHLFSVCTYFADEILPAGTFVRVPFGRQTLIGVVWDAPIDTTFPDTKIKSVTAVLDISPMTAVHRAFIDWVAAYTLSPPGLVLKMALPIADMDKQSRKPLLFEAPDLKPSSMTFSPEQQKAIDVLSKTTGFQVTLLDGVTGSGKTEVYFEAVAAALKQGHQVLVLLPEITLTSAWLERFEKRFGVKPACWHSGLTPKVRRDTWQAVLSGTARVIVGARSALFLPYQTLGLIVVDEEHDASYKQEDGVVYQARDMAIVRAHLGGFPIVLASATPSIETYCNVLDGRYACVQLPERYANAALPDLHIIDMRSKEKRSGYLSMPLIKAMAQAIEQHNQTLLFLNRRGYAPMMLCKACGEKIKCPHCSVLLTEHRHQHVMQCHHCGYTMPVPVVCPACGEKECFISCGPGVERIEEEVCALFPNARVEVITSDTVSTPARFEEMTTRLMHKEIDILIGTQMLAKGHHFPDLTVVGIIDADFGLSGGDLRASERTFQLLQQVSGRAGRAGKKGDTYLQTYSPENGVIKAMETGDRTAFMNAETEARRLLNMPPFGRLASVIISGAQERLVQRMAQTLIQKAPFLSGVEFLGPVQAPIYQLRGKYRYRILVKSGKKVALQKIIRAWLAPIAVPAAVTVKVDIDPYSFL